MNADAPTRRERILASLLLGGLICLLLALVGRMFVIQTSLRPDLVDRLQRQQTSFQTVPERRGMILDRKGRVLAASHMAPSVFVDPQRVTDLPRTAEALARILDLDVGWVHNAIFSNLDRRFVWIEREIDWIEADAIRELRLDGVGVRTEAKRAYPQGKVSAHVLGFVGRDGAGLEGVELAVDKRLSGRPGQALAMVDTRRRAIWPLLDRTIRPTDGGHIILTIDAALQEFTEHTIQDVVTKFKAESGVGLVVAPHTGEILAMVSYPGYDPANPTASPIDHRRNRCLTDPVEPGSVFKPIIAAAVLNEGLTRPDEMINCENGLAYFGSRPIKDSHPMGLMTMSQVVSHSSNIGMAKIGTRLGDKRMYDYLRRYGLGELTGLGLSGESAGIVYPTTRWSKVSAQSISFGQEVAVTPLQLVNAFNAIANEGTLLRPRLIHQVLDAAGNVIEDNSEPIVVGRVLQPDVARTMIQRVLRETVTEGSGKECNLELWQIGGKTGTAQIPRKGGGYQEGAYLSSFIGTGPTTRPQVTVLVMIRRPDPRIGYYGRQVAVPAVARILEYALTYLQIPPDRDGNDSTKVAAAHDFH